MIKKEKTESKNELIQRLKNLNYADFKYFNPMVDGRLFLEENRNDSILMNRLSIQELLDICLNRIIDIETGKKLVETNPVKPNEYMGLMERLLEIRLAACLHANGIISLLDKLNYSIVKNDRKSNAKLSYGCLIR